MSTVRLRRLQSDYQKLRSFVKQQPRVRLVQAEGEPPERYQLEYQVRGLRQRDGELTVVNSHLVEVLLPRAYPRMPPVCRMLTPVFHPNIAPHAICIGDHWNPGEPLWSMVARIGEMIAYQSYNTKSPLNGEAARWVEENLARLPLDALSLCVDDPAMDRAVEGAGAAALPAPPVAAPRPAPAGLPAPAPRATPPGTSPRPVPAAAPRPALGTAPPPVPMAAPAAPAGPPPLPLPAAEPLVVQCPGCNARYRIAPPRVATRVRCKHCQGILTIPGSG